MPHQAIHIRPALPQDIEGIMDIELDSFPEGIRESKEILLERINCFGDGFLVLELAGFQGCVGYIASELWTYRASMGIGDFTLGHSISSVHNQKGEELYISSMGTMRAIRGNGFGEMLFKELFDRVLPRYPQIKSAVLIVSSAWLQGRRIYEKSGFKELFTIDSFFKPDSEPWSDGIVMRKKL